MARDIQGKLAAGEQLDDDDIKYAVDRGIELPEEYGQKVSSFQMDVASTFGRPPGSMTMQTGPQFPSAGNGQPGIFLSADQLGGLTKEELQVVAEAAGIEVNASQKKNEMVSALIGGQPVADNEDDSDLPEDQQ